MDIQISAELKEKVPELALGIISCNVEILKYDEVLWREIEHTCKEIHNNVAIEEIRANSAINASRKAYKACGKDPARYRLSSEALMRRTVKGNSLYQINNVVDFVNLISLKTGFSIGGYDQVKIDGNIEFGIGNAYEPYEGIGRGVLNIEFLPVFRDQKGAFGSPTSDSPRTCVTDETKQFMMVLIGFNGEEATKIASKVAIDWLNEYEWASNVKFKIVK